MLTPRGSEVLSGPALRRLPVGSVTPAGWMKRQLVLQANGLAGHLAQFWPDVQKSIWIGGDQDQGLHERTPYWLNGIVPLAFLLKRANLTSLPAVTGIYMAPHNYNASNFHNAPKLLPVNVMDQAVTYIGELLNPHAFSSFLRFNT